MNVVDAKEMVNVVDAAFTSSPALPPGLSCSLMAFQQMSCFTWGEKFAFEKACLLVVQEQRIFHFTTVEKSILT